SSDVCSSDLDYPGTQQSPEIVAEISSGVGEHLNALTYGPGDWSSKIPQDSPGISDDKYCPGDERSDGRIDDHGVQVDQCDGPPHKKHVCGNGAERWLPQRFQLGGFG